MYVHTQYTPFRTTLPIKGTAQRIEKLNFEYRKQPFFVKIIVRNLFVQKIKFLILRTGFFSTLITYKISQQLQ